MRESLRNVESEALIKNTLQLKDKIDNIEKGIEIKSESDVESSFSSESQNSNQFIITTMVHEQQQQQVMHVIDQQTFQQQQHFEQIPFNSQQPLIQTINVQQPVMQQQPFVHTCDQLFQQQFSFNQQPVQQTFIQPFNPQEFQNHNQFNGFHSQQPSTKIKIYSSIIHQVQTLNNNNQTNQHAPMQQQFGGHKVVINKN